MRTHSNHKIWFTALLFTALLLLSFAVGCGDPDKSCASCGSGGSPSNPLTPPTVVSVTPTSGSTLVCPITAKITATFSKAMNPATINTSTFTLSGSGGTSVAGTVTYNAATNIATFTPSAGLAPSTTFTATITTGAVDTFGNHLAANFAWTFTTPALCTPTVISVTPPNGSTIVCPNVAVITATFSKAMNPATINTSTFTLAGPSGASVSGTVTYDAATNIATFTPPAASLTPSTKFTATITTGAADTFGDPLAANFVWTFTTSPSCLLPPPSGLGAACSFGILAATPVVSNVGPTLVTGDVGIWPAASVTGFPPGSMTGNGGVPHLGDAVAMTAQGDLTTAYNNAANAGGGPSVGTAITADIGGQTLPPGIYKATTILGITGILTLDGSTNPNGVWIIKVGSALTTAAGSSSAPASQVKLIGGAQAHNVFWQIGSSATLGTFSTFQGTIMAQASITLGTGATLNGRALARTGAIALDSNPVNVPPCP